MIPECNNVSRCFVDTQCVYNRQLKYNTCACDKPFDTYNYCNKTVFSAYKGNDLYYAGASIVLFSILTLLYLLEMSIDFSKKKYTPILFTKGVMVFFILLRIAYLGFWIVSSINETGIYKKHSFIVESLGTLILIASNMLIIFSWLDLVLMAKNIGNRAKSMRVIKKMLFIAMIVVVPLLTVVIFISQIIDGILIFTGISIIMLIVLAVLSMIVSIVCLVIIMRWINSDKDSKIKNRMRLKSGWVIALLVGMFGILFIMVLSTFIITGGPQPYLGIEISKRVIEIPMAVFMFFFLETGSVSAIKNGRFSFTTERTNESDQPDKSSGKSNKSGKSTSSTEFGDLGKSSKSTRSVSQQNSSDTVESL